MVTLLKMQPRYSQSSRESVTPSSRTSPLASYKEVPSPQDLTLGSHSSECPHLSRPRAVSSFSSDLVRGVHGAARRETRDARNEGGSPTKRKKSLSRLGPSVTRVVICVSRAICSTDQEKRETAPSLPPFPLLVFPLPLPVPSPPSAPYSPGFPLRPYPFPRHLRHSKADLPCNWLPS